MAFDQGTRNQLQRFVSDARTLLTEEFTRQLQHQYGLDPTTGEVTDLAKITAHLTEEQRETAQRLRETLDHYLAGSPSGGKQEALDRIVREQAFTVLNRLCALRMAEARGLLIESVAKGYQSKGFQLYARVAGSALGETGDSYRGYLFSVFDEFGVDLPVLFDRFCPQGRLFPREAALLALLELVNHAEIEPLWAEDETIGWIYQFFNSKEERKKMRDESAAPRNSRELAVRNQFFTPRYVVEFLTDNTLGRIWYEMTKGQTSLKDSCRYLVRRPNEIFLGEGELPANDQGQVTDDVSQEELLKQPVCIPHRPLKDPREIRMLDPACGSMHFGLYAFDLFETIYEEAWDLQAAGQWPAPNDPTTDHGQLRTDYGLLTADYPTKEALLRDVPRLIIERNIHGIDIDPRAVQIAGLSLWLRAQRSWQADGVKPQDRPRVRRSNVVCAEPMPGEESLLDEFLDEHLSADPERKLLGQLVQRVFEAMKLAGDAGSLLRVEEEIAESVAEAKKAWLARPQKKQRLLFDAAQKLVQQELGLDVSGITDEAFWAEAENKIYASLRAYAEHAENGGGYQRRLFAADAARGFAFIDLCRKRYDVVLMNPPFGEPSRGSRNYISLAYPRTKGDIYAAFVERWLGRLEPRSLLGAITSRTGFFLSSFQMWREETLLKKAPPVVFADLGYGVLDAAMVEVAAYCLESQGINNSAIFLRVVDVPSGEKGRILAQDIAATCTLQPSRRTFNAPLHFCRSIPTSPFAYWAPNTLLNAFAANPRYETGERTALQGASTCDDFRYVRAWFEVARAHENSGNPGVQWVGFARGGRFRRFYSDVPAVIRWNTRNTSFHGFIGRPGRWNPKPVSADHYLQPALTWPLRGSIFSATALPAGCAYSVGGKVALAPPGELGFLLSVFNSSVFNAAISLFAGKIGGFQYETGVINSAPIPQSDSKTRETLVGLGRSAWRLEYALDTSAEHSHAFVLPSLLQFRGCTLAERAVAHSAYVRKTKAELTAIQREVDSLCFDLYGINKADQRSISDRCGDSNDTAPSEAIGTLVDAETEAEDEESDGSDDDALIADLLAYAVGSVNGRWDIRLATGERPTPELPEPFAPLPICSPGMLQGDAALPLTQENESRLRTEGRWQYPVEIPWGGILVDAPGHPLDIETRIRQVLEIIWKDCADAIEREACEILEVKTLREYVCKPSAFFADHLKRYSKSRRQAPIYWPLSTASGGYTLWIYYHRLTDQTLYTCVNDFVEPKLKQIAGEIQRFQTTEGKGGKANKEYEELTQLEQELKDFRDELLRLAKFWKPNLNDGVQITAAPLWKLFQYRPWQKKLKETWGALEAGEYDWAHLAYSIWPDRVREKCRTDKSLAIAHGLEELYQEPEKPAKKKRGKNK
jgi:hypothetical protein